VFPRRRQNQLMSCGGVVGSDVVYLERVECYVGRWRCRLQTMP